MLFSRELLYIGKIYRQVLSKYEKKRKRNLGVWKKKVKFGMHDH